MRKVDFILVWDWIHDKDFINKFEERAKTERVTCLFINPNSVKDTLNRVRKEQLKFKVLLDRASDTDAAFDPLVDEIILEGTRCINEVRHAMKAIDKATMHLELLNKRIDVPHTIIISPPDLQRIQDSVLDRISRPFIVKPALGGGGEGVTLAWNLDDVKKIHEAYRGDKYLLQEKVSPILLDGKRSYFRIFYACGNIIPCWWDNETHIYGNIVSNKEQQIYNLKKIMDITKIIAEISKLDFFSTEICLTDKKKFVVVDYVNDPCDMRPKSACQDGVPDHVINEIIASIINYIKHAKEEDLTPLRKKFIVKRRDVELKLLRRYR